MQQPVLGTHRERTTNTVMSATMMEQTPMQAAAMMAALDVDTPLPLEMICKLRAQEKSTHWMCKHQTMQQISHTVDSCVKTCA